MLSVSSPYPPTGVKATETLQRIYKKRGLLIKLFCVYNRLQNNGSFFSHTLLACTCEARKSLSPVSLSIFSLAPDLSMDLSRVLDCRKILTVLSVKAYKSPLRSVGGS